MPASSSKDVPTKDPTTTILVIPEDVTAPQKYDSLREDFQKYIPYHPVEIVQHKVPLQQAESSRTPQKRTGRPRLGTVFNVARIATRIKTGTGKGKGLAKDTPEEDSLLQQDVYESAMDEEVPPEWAEVCEAMDALLKKKQNIILLVQNKGLKLVENNLADITNNYGAESRKKAKKDGGVLLTVYMGTTTKDTITKIPIPSDMDAGNWPWWFGFNCAHPELAKLPVQHPYYKARIAEYTGPVKSHSTMLAYWADIDFDNQTFSKQGGSMDQSLRAQAGKDLSSIFLSSSSPPSSSAQSLGSETPVPRTPIDTEIDVEAVRGFFLWASATAQLMAYPNWRRNQGKKV